MSDEPSVLSAILDRSMPKPVALRDLGAGDVLFRQGDRAASLYAVEEGRVRLMRYLHDGKPVCLHVAPAGQTFAEAALMSDIYHCNAVADEKTRVRVYPKEQILEGLRHDPSFALAYVASLSREVQRLRAQLELRSVRSARERILQFLALEGGADAGAVRIAGSLKALASELGMAHETLYRELARLESEGAIARDDTTIRLRKPPTR